MSELFASPLLSLEELELIKGILDREYSEHHNVYSPKVELLIDKINQEIKDLKFEINRQS